MNNVQKINYGPLGADLRIIIDDEQKIWFVAKDIGEMLELKNIRYNLAELPKGVSNTYPLATDGGVQNLTVVSEGGLYRLVFKSRKPEAEAFVTWVTEEVLPQIRKTGSYSVKPEATQPSAQQVEYHLRIASALGDVGFSRGVQQAYLLEQDQKQFDATAEHFLPRLAIEEARQEVAKITYDRSADTQFACEIPVAKFSYCTVSEIAKKFKDKRVTSKVINDWLCDGNFQRKVARGKYVKLKRGEDTAVCRKTFTGATAGQDIINGWRYTAEIQKYLDRCYKTL
jgi:prophage antirepressor-like protein